MTRERRMRQRRRAPESLSRRHEPSWTFNAHVGDLVLAPMTPVEWLATLLWDRHGERRRAQMVRLARGTRKLHEFDRVNQRSAQQIRRTQDLGRQLERHS
jgi:hypothetical protein